MERSEVETYMQSCRLVVTAEDVPGERWHLTGTVDGAPVLSALCYDATPDLTTLGTSILFDQGQRDVFNALSATRRRYFLDDISERMRYISANSDMQIQLEGTPEAVPGTGPVPALLSFWISIHDLNFVEENLGTAISMLQHTGSELIVCLDAHLGKDAAGGLGTGVEPAEDFFAPRSDFNADWKKVDDCLLSKGFITKLRIDPGPDAHWEIHFHHPSEPHVPMGAQCAVGNQSLAVRIIARVEAHSQLVAAYANISELTRLEFWKEVLQTVESDGLFLQEHKHASTGIVSRYGLLGKIYQFDDESLFELVARARKMVDTVTLIYQKHLADKAIMAAAQLSSKEKAVISQLIELVRSIKSIPKSLDDLTTAIRQAAKRNGHDGNIKIDEPIEVRLGEDQERSRKTESDRQTRIQRPGGRPTSPT